MLVIIKKMSSRKIISVIDAILNVGVALVLRFKDIIFVDRVGAMCSVGEIVGILFGDESGREEYFQKLRRDLISTLEEVGCANAIVHKRGMLGISIAEIQCDYYDCLSGKKSFESCYFGEYMSQYSFAEYTNAQLNAKTRGR